MARGLLPCLIKPLESREWWEKMLALVDAIAAEIPGYVLHFDTSGQVVDVLRRM
ncbi:MAG: hypothetical protein GTN93_18590 [Anaerolineae bacterium]|nr:hypothetical protein [Anaerolineae bacterium]